jgi:DNA-directed RNA polymerase specialized sigma24 family protein
VVADPDLLARAAAGDGAAFAGLVEPHQRAVFRHCYSMLGSGADAEDATQDTLERAWRRLVTYDGSGPFGAWLQRIATNICLDELRAKRTRIGPASRTGLRCGLGGATASPPSRPTSRTARAAWPPAACRSSSSPPWPGSR